MPRSRNHSTSKPAGVNSSCWRIRTGFTSPASDELVAPRSVLDGDGLHRTGVGRLVRPLAQRRVDLPLPTQDVVLSQLEDLGRDTLTLAVALAKVHVYADAGHPGATLRHHAFGLLFGDGQRDVQRVGRGLGLLARPRQVDLPLLDRVAQATDPVYL